MSASQNSDMTDAIRAKAAELGLSVGFARAVPPKRIAEYRQWLAKGRAGNMAYLNRSIERRANPQLVLPGARTIISVTENYFTEFLPPEIRSDPSRGVIASYAWGQDYHDVLLIKIQQLAEFVESLAEKTETKCYVDTGHILERDYGESGGLGFIGKNTMLIQPRAGSYFFLGEILTTLELEPTPPDKTPSCGNCICCLENCPTHALPTEYILDSTLCISYLTIEYKGVIERQLRPLMGNHIFGCDDCQTCCPWNRFSKPTDETAYQGDLNRQAPKLTELAELNEKSFQDRFAGSPIVRPKFSGFMRNVAIALGNWGDEEAADALEKLVSMDAPTIRLHAAWGLGQCNSVKARSLLRRICSKDPDDAVCKEAADMLT